MEMLRIFRQFKQILLTTAFLLVAVTAMSQVKKRPVPRKAAVSKTGSSQLNDFLFLAGDADVTFTFPTGFKEAKVLNNEDFSFDYGIELPNEFAVWFQVRSQKKDWQNYMALKNDPTKQTADPDTAYIAKGSALAKSLSDDKTLIPRDIDQDVLTRYNANAGRAYLINLPDLAETNHYKYALVLAIEKDHTGTIIAICFTDEKNPEFFKNVSQISQFIKFKP